MPHPISRRALLTAAAAFALLAGSAHAQTAPVVSEVIVTAAPYAVSLNSATTSINVISRAQLDLAPPAGLGDVLANQPGLRSSAYAPGASRPIIRGLSGPRVMILQNGTGLVDASSLSPDHAVASDPGEASRIEVLRGPSALAYGGSAIGGVVNILDDRIASSRAEGLSGRASTSYDSNNDGRSLSGELKGGSGALALTASGVTRRAGDYRVESDPVSARLAAAEGLKPLHDRKVRNSAVALDAYGAGASLVGDKGFIGASVRRDLSTYGVPYAQIAGPADPDAEGPVKIKLRQTRYDLRGERRIDTGPFEKARFSVGHADYRHAEIDAASGDIGTRFLSSGAEGRLELVQRQGGDWQGAVGLQGLTRDFEAIGDEAFIPPVSIKEGGVFVLQRHDHGPWGLEGGLRLDRRTLEGELAGRPTSGAAARYGVNWARAAASRSFTNVSASFGLFARPADDLFLALSLSHNGRAPSEFELYADGPHGGTGAYEIGDPTLKSEKANSAEITARWTAQRGKAEFHLYQARYDGFIEEGVNGDRAGHDGALDPAGELPIVRFTQNDARFHGFEFAGSYDLWNGGERSLVLDASADAVRGKVGGASAARIPPYSVTVGLAYSGGPFKARLEARHVGSQDKITPYELPTAAYTLVNASLSAKPFKGRDLTVFVDGHNLTGEEAREHISFLKDIAPLPGRSIRAGLAYAF